MSWHNFSAGQRVPLDEIVATCERHILSGEVNDPNKKLKYLQQIRESGHDELVFTPQGASWGSSPLNLNSWRTVDGHPITLLDDSIQSPSQPGANNLWLFQANPKVFDFVGWLEKQKPGNTGTWTVSAYWKQMKEGDPVVFWLSGRSGGIYALGELIGEPYERTEVPTPEEKETKPYLKHPYIVGYRLTHILLEEPITRDMVLTHPVLRNLVVLKFPNATNFDVKPKEWAAIQELIGGREASGTSQESRRKKLERLLTEFKTSFLDASNGQKHINTYEKQREVGRQNFEMISAMQARGEDITDLVLIKLLPHANNSVPREINAWIHIAPAINKDIKSWYGAGTKGRKNEEWPDIARAIFKFIQRCANDPHDLPAACAEFSALPYTKGFQTGILTPILNALRPDDFLIINSKPQRVINYFTETNYSSNLKDYPAINNAGFQLLSTMAEDFHRLGITEARNADLFDAFSHWLVAIKKFDFTQRRPAPVPEAVRYWKIAPGENASKWEACHEGRYISLGWEELGDLSGITREDFDERVDEVIASHPDWKKEGLEQVWKFIHIHEGDRVVANKGTSEVLGIGTVTGTYYFVPDAEHGHRLPVRWDDSTPRKVQEGGWRKTLIEISREKFNSILQDPVPGRINPEYSLTQLSAETGLELPLLERWVRAVERKGQAILYGPPGTGKTFAAERMSKHLISGGDGFIEIVQFHPAYAYEDFIQGIRPQPDPDGRLHYPVVPGRFLEFCRSAQKRQGVCVLIIDEINRANLSRVFGELMYLLEYREAEVPLSAGGLFNIPRNVRVLGTMNTADRSIALVDYALRRRFAFLPLYPNYDVLRKFHSETGFPVAGLIDALTHINKEIADRHYEIGISFFLKKNLSDEIEDIWRMEIEPYLEEYFFDRSAKLDQFQWETIRQRYNL
jgi:hypothetical protein